MSWCRLDSGYVRHPKTLALCDILKDQRADGYISRLWAWAAGSCEAGMLPVSRAPRDFEGAVGWEGPPGALYSALVKVGLVDVVQGMAIIHDWSVWNGAHLREARHDRERKRVSYRKKDPPVEDHHRHTDGRTDVQEEETLNAVPIPKASGPLEPARTKLEPAEILQVQEAWNAHRGELSAWRLTSAKRRRAALNLAKAHPLDRIVEAIQRLASSPFATGQNDRGWKADPDFFLQPGRLEQALEGKFDARRGTKQLGVHENVGTREQFDADPYFNPGGNNGGTGQLANSVGHRTGAGGEVGCNGDLALVAVGRRS